MIWFDFSTHHSSGIGINNPSDRSSRSYGSLAAWIHLQSKTFTSKPRFNYANELLIKCCDKSWPADKNTTRASIVATWDGEWWNHRISCRFHVNSVDAAVAVIYAPCYVPWFLDDAVKRRQQVNIIWLENHPDLRLNCCQFAIKPFLSQILFYCSGRRSLSTSNERKTDNVKTRQFSTKWVKFFFYFLTGFIFRILEKYIDWAWCQNTTFFQLFRHFSSAFRFYEDGPKKFHSFLTGFIFRILKKYIDWAWCQNTTFFQLFRHFSTHFRFCIYKKKKKWAKMSKWLKNFSIFWLGSFFESWKNASIEPSVKIQKISQLFRHFPPISDSETPPILTFNQRPIKSTALHQHLPGPFWESISPSWIGLGICKSSLCKLPLN